LRKIIGVLIKYIIVLTPFILLFWSEKYGSLGLSFAINGTLSIWALFSILEKTRISLAFVYWYFSFIFFYALPFASLWVEQFAWLRLNGEIDLKFFT
jgi:hypothetical protein